MKFLLFIIFLTLSCALYGQDNSDLLKGRVSYITSQNIYVKFQSTDKIDIGDTLYLSKNDQLIPTLVVTNKSSISCICMLIPSVDIKINDVIIKQRNEPSSSSNIETLIVAKEISDNLNEKQPDNKADSSFVRAPNIGANEEKDSTLIEKSEPLYEQKIRGRISATSYNNILDSKSNHRMRYIFTLKGENLGNSKFSLYSYISFRHTLNEWDEAKNDLSKALRVYSLAVKYDLTPSASLILGRKINSKISSMGAMDGLQFEKGFGNFLVGALVGSRPDHTDYSWNFNLFQYGAYISHSLNANKKYLQSTLAYIEQRNNMEIDRRFIYLQHSGSLIKNVNLFASAEISLYENIDETPENVFNLSNLYVSLRYRASRKLNLSASYDNRKNIVYYETYKSYIDQLIDEETRQGIRLNANYRIFKNVIWGINGGYRFQKSEKDLSKNVNSYLTFNRIPALNIRTTITVNYLQTTYLTGRILGARINKELIPRKLDMALNYRYINYSYMNYETSTAQNIAGINLSWNIIKKLSIYVNYEGTFDNQNLINHRIYTKIVQRF